MSVKVQLKHSATANKAPLATDLVDGELAININAASPAAYIKDSAGAVVKLAGAGSVSTPDATTTSKGIVQLADPAGIAAGTAGLVVDAAQLKAAQATAAGSTTAPAAPAAGKVWVNSGVTPAVINVWNGSSWIPQVGATVTAPAAPTAPAAGQVWVNTSVAPNVASIWDGTAWAAAAPDGAAAAVLANDAKYATKAELAVENLWDRTGTVLSPATAGDGMAFGTDGLVYDAATKRLGIGTASPGSALDVVGEIRLTASIATSTSSFVYSYGGGSIGDVRSGINLDGSNHAITFLTDQLERARIDSNGQMRIAKGLSLGSSTLGIANTFSLFGSVINSGAGTNALKYHTGTGVVTYDTSSKLIKTSIVDCPYGLDEIKKLRPRKYWRLDDEKTEIGFVADEVFDVLPEFVPIGPKSIITKNDSDTESIPYSVNYDKLTAVLTKALQEAIAKIETLEAKVAALESA
jgi:hypothetical protein